MSIDVETPWVTDNWWTSPFNFIPEVQAFTRESGMGVALVRSQPLGLFCLHPKLVGQEASYVLGKKSGAPSIAMKLEDLGLDATEEQSKEILLRVKTLGAQKKGLVTDEEFRTIHAEVIGG